MIVRAVKNTVPIRHFARSFGCRTTDVRVIKTCMAYHRRASLIGSAAETKIRLRKASRLFGAEIFTAPIFRNT